MARSSFVITLNTYWIGRVRVSDPVVHYEGRTLVCNNLPVSLTRLIPNRWGNAPTEAWLPFLERAIILGLL
jgi:hypothetical protein